MKKIRTIEDLRKYGFRIKIKGHGEDVQRMLFGLGFAWGHDGNQYQQSSANWLFHRKGWSSKHDFGFYSKDSDTPSEIGFESLPILRRSDLRRMVERKADRDRLDKLEAMIETVNKNWGKPVYMLDRDIKQLRKEVFEEIADMKEIRISALEGKPMEPGEQVELIESWKVSKDMTFNPHRDIPNKYFAISYKGELPNNYIGLFQRALSGTAPAERFGAEDFQSFAEHSFDDNLPTEYGFDCVSRKWFHIPESARGSDNPADYIEVPFVKILQIWKEARDGS